MKPKKNFVLIALLSGLCSQATEQTRTLDLDPASPGPGKFGIEEIRRETAARGMAVLHSDAKAHAVWICNTLAIGALTGTSVVAQKPEKVNELEAAWQRQTDIFTEFAKKTLTDKPQPKAAKGQARRKPQAQ